MTTQEAQFGNAWHGRLGAGTIELVPGAPVGAITVDGVAHSVKAVAGNLGDTRYLKAPGLPVPTTPGSVTAANGEFKNDAIIYSDDFRYSPLSNKKVLNSRTHFLLWDTPAGRWRKMRIDYVVLTVPSSPTSADNSVRCQLYRGPLFGQLDTVDAASVADTFTLVSTFFLPFLINWSAWGVGYPYDAGREVHIDARHDGRRVLVNIYSYSDAGWSIVNDGQQPWAYPEPHTLLSTIPTLMLVAAWEITITETGNGMTGPVSVIPTLASLPAAPSAQRRYTSVGSPFWTGPFSGNSYNYYVPATAETRTFQGALGGTARGHWLNAAYDAAGAIRAAHYYAFTNNTYLRTQSADDFIGLVSIPNGDDPASHVPPYNGPTGWFDISNGAGDPFSPYSINRVNGPVEPTFLLRHQIRENGDTVLYEWTGYPTAPLEFHRLTNNVVEIRQGTQSIVRVGPGVVDSTPIAQEAYASWNPRTGQLLSSTSPIGFV